MESIPSGASIWCKSICHVQGRVNGENLSDASNDKMTAIHQYLFELKQRFKQRLKDIYP